MRQKIYRRAFAVFCVLLVFFQMIQVAASYHQERLKALEEGGRSGRGGKGLDALVHG